jgi:hypothetical protein
MAGMETPEGTAGGDRDGRGTNRGWLTESITWFGVGAFGMLAVFIGLGVEAWRHDGGASEGSLLSLTSPGHVIMGIGLALTAIAVMAGLTAGWMRRDGGEAGVVRRVWPVAAAWAVLAAVAIGALAYAGVADVTFGEGGDGTMAMNMDMPDDANAENPEAGGVVRALEGAGIDPDATDPQAAEGALAEGTKGNANAGPHDMGTQPTYTQFQQLSDGELLPMFPANTVKLEDLPVMRQQVQDAREVALRLDTPEKAAAAGYVRTTSDVPYMGEHYLNLDYVRDGVFDPKKPEGLLFSKIDSGPERLVGVWFLQVPGIGGVTRETQPAGFASDLDMWHSHVGLCLVGLSGASEGETEASCVAKGGKFTADLRWMMHLWVYPESSENPDGMMSYLNSDLFEKQQAASKDESAPSGVSQ